MARTRALSASDKEIKLSLQAHNRKQLYIYELCLLYLPLQLLVSTQEQRSGNRKYNNKKRDQATGNIKTWKISNYKHNL